MATLSDTSLPQVFELKMSVADQIAFISACTLMHLQPERRHIHLSPYSVSDMKFLPCVR